MTEKTPANINNRIARKFTRLMLGFYEDTGIPVSSKVSIHDSEYINRFSESFSIANVYKNLPSENPEDYVFYKVEVRIIDNDFSRIRASDFLDEISDSYELDSYKLGSCKNDPRRIKNIFIKSGLASCLSNPLYHIETGKIFYETNTETILKTALISSLYISIGMLASYDWK